MNAPSKVALEVLAYHNAPAVDEVEELVSEGVPTVDLHSDVQK